MAASSAVRNVFQDLLSKIPKISNENYESIVSESVAFDENELEAFELAVRKIPVEKIWTCSTLLNKWNSSEEATSSSENVWEEIAQDVTSHQNPFHTIIAIIHIAQLPKNVAQNMNKAAAAAVLYLVLQRCPGARSRGLTNSITFHHTLKVLSYFTENPSGNDNAMREDEPDEDDIEDEDTEMYEPASSSRSRKCNRKKNTTNPQTSLEHCATRLLRELDTSLKFLPLVVNEDSETLSATVEVLVNSLDHTEIPSFSTAASQALCHVAMLAQKDAEMLVFKGIMPLFLGEKRKSGSSLASSSRSSRNAGMTVVSQLLDMLNSNNKTDHPLTLAASLLVLIEHLCHKAPEKAEMRVTVVEAVDTILQRLPAQQQEHFTSFISKFSRSSRVNHRIFAVDLVAELLKGTWIWSLEKTSPSSPTMNEHDVPSTPQKLLSVIVSRASDKAPTVRSRSLGALAALTGAASSHEEKVAFVHAFLNHTAISSTTPSTSSSSSSLTPSILGENKHVDIGVLLRRRLSDERAMVRRSAAQAMASFITLSISARDVVESSEVTDETTAQYWRDEITALVSLCGDVSVATRKAAAASLASLRSILPRSGTLRQAFVGAILPLAHDAEASVQIRCGDLIKDAILEPLAEWGKQVSDHISKINSNEQELDWTGTKCDPCGVWFLLAGARSSEAQQCFQSLFWPVHLRVPDVSFTHPGNFLCGASSLNSILGALRQGALFGSISKDSEDEEHQMYDDDYERKHLQRLIVRTGAWVLLEALLCPNIQGHNINSASSQSNLEASFVISCWRRIWQEIEATQNIQDFEMDAQRILRVLSHLAPSIPAQDATSLAAELLTLLQNFDVTATTASDMLRALMSLCTAKAPTPEAGAGMCAACVASLLENAHVILKSYVFPDEEPPNIALVERALFAIGEVGLLAFSPDDNGLAANGKPVLEVDISPDVVSLLRVLLGTTLPPDASRSPDDEAVPDSVRAFAFVALGKVCLVDQGMAKECVTLLVREIDESSDEESSPAVRSNALLVLGDLCVRYTSMVERHLPALARCLQSKHALMRRHALLLLSQLLLQDFLKWRGLMLHRFLLCCVDEDAEVCQLATYLITGPLVQKQASLLSHAPLELLFTLNGYEDHPRYQSALYQGSDGCGSTAVNFDDVDALSLNKRARLLRFVCGALNDEQRIETTARVSQEVLAAPDVSFAPDSLGFSVLRDALVLLSSPEIKVGSGSSGEGVTEEEMVTAAANGHAASVVTHTIENAKKKLLSKMSKKQLMEHVVPMVLDLKAKLESMRSPLLKDLMAFLVDLLKTYRVEARAVLSVTDPVLSKELEYDLKNFEKQQKKQRQLALQSSIKTSGSSRSPINTVAFSSPKASSSSSSSNLVKSIKGNNSTKKGFPTPKLRGDAETPRTERTPRAAISSALGRPETTPNIAQPQVKASGDYSLSTTGLNSLLVEDRASTPVELHIESKPQRVWSVTVPDGEPSKWSPNSSSSEPMDTENRSPVIHSPSPANKKKAKKGHKKSKPLNNHSVNGPVSDSLSGLSSSSSSSNGGGVVQDSLAGMRPPNHRTPTEGKKKKRIEPIS